MNWFLFVLLFFAGWQPQTECPAVEVASTGNSQLTLVLTGGATLEDAPLPEPPSLNVTAQSNANVRAEPSTGAAVVGSLRSGTTAVATGRLSDNSWAQVTLADDTVGWVFVDLVTVQGDLNTLEVIDLTQAGQTILAYLLQTLPAPDCESGILAQSGDEGVILTINNVEVNLTAQTTVFITTQDTALTVDILQGSAQITGAEVTERGIAGSQIVVSDELPSDAQAIDLTSRQFPLDQLPREVETPPVLTQETLDEALQPMAEKLVGGFYAEYNCLTFFSVGMFRPIESPTYNQKREYTACSPTLRVRYTLESRDDEKVSFVNGNQRRVLNAEDFSALDGVVFGGGQGDAPFVPVDGRSLPAGGMRVAGGAPLPVFELTFSRSENISLAGKSFHALVYTGGWTAYVGDRNVEESYTIYYEASTGMLLRVDTVSTVIACNCDRSVFTVPFVQRELSWGLTATNQRFDD